MNVTFSDEELAFRDEIRRAFRDEFPEDLRRKQDIGVELARDDMVRFMQWLHERGWAGVNWPVEYGGTGWSPVQKYLFAAEMAEANAPTIVPFGLSMVGPVVYTFGNDEQKERFLPDILASNVWWCQGYSEPGSGSDLASLKTRADLAGDHYVLNGTKTWTTLGQYADWIFVLARTNTDVARRQEGISFLLVDMQTPGVSVKPIITIEGGHEVNEVHFEDVKVPVENLVGDEGRGWTYGKVLLEHERANIAGVAKSRYRLRKLREQVSTSVRGATAAPRRPQLHAQTRGGRDRTQGARIHGAANARRRQVGPFAGPRGVDTQSQRHGRATGYRYALHGGRGLLRAALRAGPVRRRR